MPFACSSVIRSAAFGESAFEEHSFVGSRSVAAIEVRASQTTLRSGFGVLNVTLFAALVLSLYRWFGQAMMPLDKLAGSVAQ
jgi:hypothetical protein